MIALCEEIYNQDMCKSDEQYCQDQSFNNTCSHNKWNIEASLPRYKPMWFRNRLMPTNRSNWHISVQYQVAYQILLI